VDFGIFSIFAILIAVAGIRVVATIFRNRHEIFDENFTDADRVLVDQTAFFLLLPLSVALHELGHATLVWVFGGEVVDFGFYFFAGFVSYVGAFSDVQHILVSVAGIAVNVFLATAALLFIFLRKPPMRAAFNELLVQFVIISIANALIFYPLLDFATGMNGDFQQMYFGGVPWLSVIILICHLSVLAVGYIAFKSERISAKLSALTGLPPHVRRGFMGGFRSVAGAPPVPEVLPPTQEELTIQGAVKRVASGWPDRLSAAMTRRPQGPLVILRWNKPDGDRAVSISQEPAGSVAISLVAPGTRVATSKIWQRWAVFPTEDELVIGVRMAMEEADRRPPAILPSPTGET